MAEYDDLFPTRTGNATGSANERQMLDTVPDPHGLSTRVRQTADGETTLLKTKGGMPRFINAPTLKKEPPTEDFRGFVALLRNMSTAVEKYTNPILVKLLNAAKAWKLKFSPIRKDGGFVRYFVSDIRSTKSFTEVQVEHRAEILYNDVYLAADGKYYRNGKGVGTNSTGDDFVPVVLNEKKPTHVFPSSEAGVRCVVSLSGVELASYRFSDFFQPLVTGWEIYGGFRFDRVENRLDFQAALISPFGSYQLWQAQARLFASAPWIVSVDYFRQINHVMPIRPQAVGWTSVGSQYPDSPKSTPLASALVVGRRYIYTSDTTPRSYAGDFISAGYKANAALSLATYESGNGDSYEVPLFSGFTALFTRSLTVNTNYQRGVIPFYGTWPESQPLYNPNYLPHDGLYFWNTPGGDITTLPNILQGDQVDLVCADDVEQISFDDTSSVNVEIAGVGVIYTANSQRSNAQLYAVGQSYVPVDPSSTLNMGGGAAYIGVRRDYRTTQSSTPEDRISHSSFASGVSKDYLFVDTSEAVFVYLKGTMNSTHVESPGGANFTLELVVDMRGEVVSHLIIEKTDALGNYLASAQFPDGINMGSGFVWSYWSPNPPQPIFMPKWFEQGACPHIAYTLNSEAKPIKEGGEAQKKLWAYSFAIQVRRLKIPEMAETTPPPQYATIVHAPMFEQMLDNYCSGSRGDMWRDLENSWVHFSGGTPGSEWEMTVDPDAPVTNTTFAHIYRT